MPPTAEPANDEREEPRLGLSVCLDRPFSELKQFLLDELERAYVGRCIADASNLSQASRASGLSRKHLRTLMAKHGIRASSVELDHIGERHFGFGRGLVDLLGP